MSTYETCPAWCVGDHDEVPADGRVHLVGMIEHRRLLASVPGRMRAELLWTEACAEPDSPGYFEEPPILAIWDTPRRFGGSMIEVPFDRAGLDFLAALTQDAERIWLAQDGQQVAPGNTCDHQPTEAD